MSLSKQDLLTRAMRVKALVLDVDGVLTDASLFYSARGESLKAFSARDGFAIRLAVASDDSVNSSISASEGCTSSLPASIFERFRISLMMPRRCLPLW